MHRKPLQRSAPIAVAAAALLAVPLASAAVGPHGVDSAVKARAGKADSTQAARHAIVGGKARNVIVLIGDGMGDSEITIARNYQVGANGRLAMDAFPLSGEYTTYSVQKDDPSLPDYVTDSAASGTGWSTGHKTYDGAISVLPSGKPVPTILELAKKAGYSTGDIATAELSDATPAVLASHVVDRGCQGPEDMAGCAVNDKANGGAGSIAEQMTETGVDVLMGGAAARWDQTVQAGTYAGLTVAQEAQVRGYNVVRDASGLAAANAKKPLLGLFAAENMDLEWVGPTPTATGTAPSTCSPNPDYPPTEPHLSDLTRKALSILTAKSAGKRHGFFLQIEGASIDKQDHAANPCGQIGETIEFDRAVRMALNYQKSHPDTLVVVTADHGHTSQIVEAGSTTPGVTATLVTRDGADMTISYATTVFPGSQQHTGTEVRIVASGPQAANVLGTTNQTDLFFTMKRALGLT
jgi:alkaline phosphatase